MSARAGQGIDRPMRLRRRQEFLDVQRDGSKLHGRAFLALVSPGGTAGAPVGRVGITVTRRVGNAVVRNRIKRLVREWFRCNGWVPAGHDVVIVARESAAALRGLGAVGAELAPLQARLERLAR